MVCIERTLEAFDDMGAGAVQFNLNNDALSKKVHYRIEILLNKIVYMRYWINDFSVCFPCLDIHNLHHVTRVWLEYLPGSGDFTGLGTITTD